MEIKKQNSNNISSQRSSYISSNELFITESRKTEYFLRDNNPQLVQGGYFAQSNDSNWFELTVNSYGDIKDGLDLGNKILKVEGKSIYNGHFMYGRKGIDFSFASHYQRGFKRINFGKLFKGITYDPTEQLLKTARKFARKSTVATKYVKVGSKFVKKLPFLGIGIAAYDIRQSWLEHGNSFDFWEDTILNVADAFSPIPFTKEIIKGVKDYEVKQAADFLNNINGRNMMPLPNVCN